MENMDNNTAPNDGFSYPDFAQNTSNNQQQSTTPAPVTDDSKVLEDLATQLTSIEAGTPIQQSVQPDTPQSVPANNVVPQQVPSNVPQENVVVVTNPLEEIIPGTKVPKAFIREPKENNLAKPINTQQTTEVINVQTNTPTPLQNNNPSFDDITSNGHNTVIDTPTTKTIDDLLRYTIDNDASDLHLSVGYPAVVRIDGILREVDDKIISPQDAEELILPVLSDEKKELLEVNKEIDFAYFYQADKTARFRVNAYYSMKNLAAAFRLIPSRVRTIEELFLPQLYHQFAQLKQGLILVTGPTGHGKSTTLAAILEDVNRTRPVHIITIEDPIEYVFEGKKALIDQREMNEDTHSWPIALRSALRQDPDVILVGEMRDYETIAAAITLAETGHLVFATLHTNNAAQTIDRIIDVFPENQQPQVRSQLSNILEAIVAQRLLPLDAGGRRAVSEILVATPAIRNIIREGKTHHIDNVIRTSSDLGMVSLERALVNLVREGVISVQRAQEYAVFPEEVLRLLKS
jgi:twitching motility protein PilT